MSERQDLSNAISNISATHTDKSIFPLTHLGVLKISENDAGKLLQGQITCNVNELSQQRSSIAAICNPKGRVIATFIIVKYESAFLLVVSADLLETVKTRLKMYILRSDAKIEDASDEFCLLGLNGTPSTGQVFYTELLGNIISVNLPARKLLIADSDSAIQFWTQRIDTKGYCQSSADEWKFLDIVSGMPWVTAETSEEFIPQMLNLDKLGGISFNKGCYTGQEIVARTHYLGKTKRELYRAGCKTDSLPTPNSVVTSSDSQGQEAVGKVLQAAFNPNDPQHCLMLVILQTSEMALKDLYLDGVQTQLTLQPLTYD